MKESKAVNVSKHNIREEQSRKYHFYPVKVSKNYSPVYHIGSSKDAGVQYNYKRDNVICTCKNISALRRQPELKYLSSPKHIYAYHGSRSYTNIGVGSVKALQRKKVRRIYLPETDDRGVGSSNLSSLIGQRSRYHPGGSYYDNKNTPLKCVGGVIYDNIEILHKKLSPITYTKSGTTSPTFSLENCQKKNVEIGSNTQVKCLVTTATQIEDEHTKTGEVNEIRVIKISIDQVKEIPKPNFKEIKSMTTSVEKKGKRVSRRAQEAERIYSSDSLVQHVHNLENPSEDKIPSPLTIDPMENQLEREYRKMFSIKSRESKDYSVNEKQDLDIKSTSVVRRRFEALRRNLTKKEESKKNAGIIIHGSSHVSTPSRKDVSIVSDPPSLEGKSYSNTKVYAPFATMNPRDRDAHSRVGCNKSYVGKKEWSRTEEDQSDCQDVKGMFNLWGKKFNLEDEDNNAGTKEKIHIEIPKVSMQLPKKSPIEVEAIQKPTVREKESKKEGKKFFFFKKRSKDKAKEPYKQKKGVTAGRCEVGDGLMIKIGAVTPRPQEPKEQIIVDQISEQYEEMLRRAKLQQFLAKTIESRHSVKVRWNNNAYATSSSTVFEIMENVYKDTELIFRSKSEVNTVNSSTYRSYTKQHVNFVQDIEAWMIPKLITDKFGAPPIQIQSKDDVDRKDGIEVIISDQKLLTDKSKAIITHKIEVVLHSKIFAKPTHRCPSSEYLLIVIPKGFYSDTSSESPEPAQTSNEELYKIVEYESPESHTRLKKNINLETGDYLSSDIQVAGSARDRNDNEYKLLQTVIKPPILHRDVDGNKVNIPEKSHIRVGIITQKDVGKTKRQTLEIQDSDYSEKEEEDTTESNTQDYYSSKYRSWFYSDNQGDGSKSCSNIYDDFLASTIISSCETSCCSHYADDEQQKREALISKFICKFRGKHGSDSKPIPYDPNKRVLPKDSQEVFRKRKLYANSNRSKWYHSDDCPNSIPSTENKCISGTSENCPKLKKSCYKRVVETNRRQKGKEKHVSLPDCETMNNDLAAQLVCRPPGILSFKGSAKCEACKRNEESCSKHTKLQSSPTCEIPPPYYPCLEPLPPCNSPFTCAATPVCDSIPCNPPPCNLSPCEKPTPRCANAKPFCEKQDPCSGPAQSCEDPKPSCLTPKSCIKPTPFCVSPKLSCEKTRSPCEKPQPPCEPRPLCEPKPSCEPKPPCEPKPTCEAKQPCEPKPPCGKLEPQCGDPQPFCNKPKPTCEINVSHCEKSKSPCDNPSLPCDKPSPPCGTSEPTCDKSKPHCEKPEPPCEKPEPPCEPKLPCQKPSPPCEKPTSPCEKHKPLSDSSTGSKPCFFAPQGSDTSPCASPPRTPPCHRPNKPCPPALSPTCSDMPICEKKIPHCRPTVPPCGRCVKSASKHKKPKKKISGGSSPICDLSPPCTPRPCHCSPSCSQRSCEYGPLCISDPCFKPSPSCNHSPVCKHNPPCDYSPPCKHSPPCQHSPPSKHSPPCEHNPPFAHTPPCKHRKPCKHSPPPCKHSETCVFSPTCIHSPPSAYSPPCKNNPPCYYTPSGTPRSYENPGNPPSTLPRPHVKKSLPKMIQKMLSPRGPPKNKKSQINMSPTNTPLLYTMNKNISRTSKQPSCTSCTPRRRESSCPNYTPKVISSCSMHRHVSRLQTCHSKLRSSGPSPSCSICRPAKTKCTPACTTTEKAPCMGCQLMQSQEFPWPTNNQVSNQSSCASVFSVPAQTNNKPCGPCSSCSKHKPSKPQFKRATPCVTCPPAKCPPESPKQSPPVSPPQSPPESLPASPPPEPKRKKSCTFQPDHINVAPRVREKPKEPKPPGLLSRFVSPDSLPPCNPRGDQQAPINGIFLKMKPRCTDCQSSPTNFSEVESDERIVINIKKSTPSTEEIREGLNIKVQDEDGRTLYERRDYNPKNVHHPSVLDDMYKNSRVHQLSTSRIMRNIDKDQKSNTSLVEPKSEASIANLIEINFKLKVTQGDKTTELNLANNSAEKTKTGTRNQTTSQVFLVKDEAEQCAEEPNEKNDINIRIVIKNYKAKKKVEDKIFNVDDEFVNNITEKFHTVSTGYSNDLQATRSENVFSVHRATVELASSNEASKIDIAVSNEAKSIDEILQDALDTVTSHSATEKTATELSESKLEEEPIKKENDYEKIKSCIYKDRVYIDKTYLSMTDIDDLELTNASEEPTNEFDKSSDGALNKSSDGPTASLSKDDQKILMKKVLAKATKNKKIKNKENMKQLKDMLKLIFTSDSSDHEDLTVTSNELVKEMTYASLHPNYFRDSDSMNNYYKADDSSVILSSRRDSKVNEHLVYPTENMSECSDKESSAETSDQTDEKQAPSCLCSAFANRLNIYAGSKVGCCCRKPLKLDEETCCDLQTDEDLFLLNYNTIEYIDVETQHSKYICSTNISVHSKSVSGPCSNSFEMHSLAEDKSKKKGSKMFTPRLSHLKPSEIKKISRNTFLGISDEDKVYLMDATPTKVAMLAQCSNEPKYSLDKYREQHLSKHEYPTDILQSYETKKAVLEMYTEKTDGKHLVAKLPKFLYDKENEIEKKYSEYTESLSKEVNNKLVMSIKR